MRAELAGALEALRIFARRAAAPTGCRRAKSFAARRRRRRRLRPSSDVDERRLFASGDCQVFRFLQREDEAIFADREADALRGGPRGVRRAVVTAAAADERFETRGLRMI